MNYPDYTDHISTKYLPLCPFRQGGGSATYHLCDLSVPQFLHLYYAEIGSKISEFPECSQGFYFVVIKCIIYKSDHLGVTLNKNNPP